MNKESVIVMLDCNSSMGKLFASGGGSDGSPALPAEAQTRFQLAKDSVKMLLEQKVSPEETRNSTFIFEPTRQILT